MLINHDEQNINKLLNNLYFKNAKHHLQTGTPAPSCDRRRYWPPFSLENLGFRGSTSGVKICSSLSTLVVNFELQLNKTFY